MAREATKYNLIVIEKGNTFTVLDESFTYDDGFKGLTGSEFEIVSIEDFYAQIVPYLDDDKKVLKYYADNFGGVTSEMIDGVDSSEEGLKELFYDLSYSELWDSFREQLGLNEEQAYIFDCIGGGRCFDKDMVFNRNTHLQHLINDFENN